MGMSLKMTYLSSNVCVWWLTLADGEALVVGIGEIDAEAKTTTFSCPVTGKGGMGRLSYEEGSKKAQQKR